MDREERTADDGASPFDLAEINRICDRFEEESRSGRRPAIEDYIAGTDGPARAALLRELLATEVELRKARGERPRAAEYHARFPDHTALIDAAFAWREVAPPPPLPAAAAAGRNLLFGLLALQNNFIDRDALLAAFNTWLADKSRPLASILSERGSLDRSRQALLEALVGEHLRLHGGDPERSLGALELGTSTPETLHRLGDPELEASLQHAGTFSTNVDATEFPFAGRSTSTGGRFRVLRPHARGGLGQVYVARDEELGRQVALKEILADKAGNPSFRSRFVLEAEINGNLEHPGIVPVYGLGTYDDGRPFYAMRFIQGDSLKEAIEQFHGQGKPRGAHATPLAKSGEPGRVSAGSFGEPGRVSAGSGSPKPRGPHATQISGPGEPGRVSAGSSGEPGRVSAGRTSQKTRGADATSLAFRKLLGRFVDVCDAIAYAHSRGVLHRDLKPANIMLGAYGETLIIDWGLAKAVGRRDPASADNEHTLVPPSGDSREPTVAGHVLGSPRYMSPEQAEGMLDSLGPATDIYGLGATLYALLTGDAPVAGSTVEEVLTKVRKGSIVPPRQVNGHVPRALDAVCRKALALRQGDRYPSARALAEDIEHWLADEPVSAFREPFVDRVRRWGRRHRTVVVAAVAALVLGSISMAGFAAVIGEKNRTLVAANLATKDAEGLADKRLDRAMAAITDYFTGFSADALKGGKLPPSLRDRLLAKPREFYEQLGAELAAKPNPSERERVLLANGQFNLGRLLEILKKNHDAISQYEAAISGLEQLVKRRPGVPDYQSKLAKAHGNLGIVLATTGKAKEAAIEYRTAIAIYESLVAKHPDVSEYQHGLALGHGLLGNVLRQIDQSADAVALHQSAVAIYEALVAHHPEAREYQNGLAASELNLGKALFVTGKSGEAAAAHLKAIAIYESLATNSPDALDTQQMLAESLHSFGNVCGDTGRPGEAAAAINKATSVYNALVARHPDVPEYQNDLAGCYWSLGNLTAPKGQFDERAAAYRKAITIYESLTTRHPDVPEYTYALATSCCCLGAVLNDAGRLDDSAAAYERALKVYEALTARHPDIPLYQSGLAANQTNLGNVRAATGRPDEAARAHRSAITIYQALTQRHPDILRYQNGLAASQSNLGIVLAAAGRADEAAGAYRAALAMLEALVTRNPEVETYQVGLARSHYNLCELLRSTGRFVEAAEEIKKAITIYQPLVARNLDATEYKTPLADCHFQLAFIRKAQGEFPDALSAFQAAAKFAPPGTPLAAALAKHISDTTVTISMARRLSGVLEGKDKPKDAMERLAFARLCNDTLRYGAAARLWAEALAADSKLAEDRQTQPRYNAACAAMLAAAGKAKHEPPLDDQAKARLRAQALVWLKNELAAWTQVLNTDPDKTRATVVLALQHWQKDPDLAAIRDASSVDNLPVAEQKEWRDLWAEVGVLLGRAQGKRP
jgi:serine/threonine protein kinase/tetratricopeptide (TPR) repeat protein